MFNVRFQVDDGTGVMECIRWGQDKDEAIILGSLVWVMGRVTQFKGDLQITVNLMQKSDDPNAETAFWLKTIDLSTCVYRLPFVGVPSSFSTTATTTTLSATSTFTNSLVENAIIECINSLSSKTFEFNRDIYGNEAIRECVVSSMPGVNVTAAIRCAFHQVIRQGIAYLRDSEGDVYEKITYEANLAAHITQIIKDEGSTDALITGVPLDLIVLRLRELAMFQHVGLETIVKSVDRLVASSSVYEVTPKHFKVVQ